MPPDSVNQPAPPGASPSPASAWQKVKTFIGILNVRLRFIALMVIVGLVTANWERLANYYDRWTRPPTAAAVSAGKDVEFYCAMHPRIVRDEPGKCPICGMPLVQRARTTDHGALPSGVLAQVQLTPLKVERGRIGTSMVERRLLSREVRTLGTVDYDETRRAFISTRIKGRIDKMFVNFVGQKVNVGDPLMLIYSPYLLVAQEQLLTVVKSVHEQTDAQTMTAQAGRAMLDAARKKLLVWGLTEMQVDDIIRRGTAQSQLTMFSPNAGIVTEKKVVEGAWVNDGDNLYAIADVSRVWVQAQIYESDIQGITEGTAVEVTTTAYPNEVFAGRMTFIAYTVDPDTRTVAARIEVDNPQYKLKPGMFATATIRLPLGKVIATVDGATTPARSGAMTAKPEIMPPTPAAAPATQSDAMSAHEVMPATQEPVASSGETMPAAHKAVPPGHEAMPDNEPLVQAYLALAVLYTQDKTDLPAVTRLTQAVEELAMHSPQAASLKPQAAALAGKDLAGQRAAFKSLSAGVIAFLRQAPPRTQLYVAHCPMTNADWITPVKEIHNPYKGSEMIDCGSITGALATASPATMPQDDEFASGYYCPLHPDALSEKSQTCPLDMQPTRMARIEKVLVVPESAVIDTGNRKVVYREAIPGSGTFDMVEVKVGPRAGEFYPVLSGLAAGDHVATQGAFLVDAENRLNPGASVQFFGADAAPGGAEHKH